VALLNGMSCPPSLITCAAPRPAISTARVTMIGWMRNAEISAPFRAPTASAAASAASTATPTP
jgi:hypothetical protein